MPGANFGGVAARPFRIVFPSGLGYFSGNILREAKPIPTAQRKAVQNHRRRQQKRGLVRLEVQAAEADKILIRKVARLLRGDPARAAEIRKRLQQVIGEERKPGLKALLTSVPLEGIELTRHQDFGRDVDV